MNVKKLNFSAAEKFKVALEAIIMITIFIYALSEIIGLIFKARKALLK